MRSTRNSTRVTALASNRRLIRATAVQVLPVPVAISTNSSLPELDFPAQRINARHLVIAPGNAAINRLGQRINPQLPTGCAPFQIVLGEKRPDRMRMRLALPVPKPDFPAIGQKDEGHLGQPGVMQCLSGGVSRADAAIPRGCRKTALIKSRSCGVRTRLQAILVGSFRQ